MMKPLNGTGDAVTKGLISAQEMLRYAMSLPVACTIAGMEKPEIVEQNLKIAQNFERMSPLEMDELRGRCRSMAADGRFELYKVSLKYDNPEARMAHGFSSKQIGKRPLGRTGIEVSTLGVGGFHLGSTKDQEEATRLVQRALEAGINFFDNAWEYHDGESEARLGHRQEAVVMTKLCTHGATSEWRCRC
jgi:aryl-alcohol dehydrogenase-like predicted oxidoreductase